MKFAWLRWSWPEIILIPDRSIQLLAGARVGSGAEGHAMPKDACTIVRLGDDSLTPGLRAQVDAIFFEASGRNFAPGPEREAFRERWLERYLQRGTDVVLVAVDARQTVAGYLVGALEDPSEQRRFDDILYFRREFRDLCRRYPAHLHVNIAPEFRSGGLGAQLIEGFAAHAREAGAPGMHVVTGKQARNAKFYARCGFSELATAVWNDGEIVFRGKSLAASAEPAGARHSR